MTNPRRVAVHCVSDSIGETAELVARAALSQWGPDPADIQRHAHVDSAEAIDRLLGSLDPHASVIVYTLVHPKLREHLRQVAERQRIPAVDVMGPVLGALAPVLPAQPQLEPGLVHRLDAEYFRKMEAVEFAVKFDDGKDPRGLYRAEVVLVGVSRSSKTPVSLYLAHRGVLVANVPLVPEIEPSPELFDQPAGKVVGLIVSPEKLREIRFERLKTIGLGPQASYADETRILEELEYAKAIFRRLGCPVIDVTNRAVEETAVAVLEMVRRRRAVH